MKKFYIAYGSNLNTAQMQDRCPDAIPVGTAELKGWELLFRGFSRIRHSGVLTIEENPECSVPIAVWSVSEEDERNLDRYEGFPTFYYKKEMRITVTGLKSGDVQEVDAFVYIMTEGKPLSLPNNAYFVTCLEGYEDFGFDSVHLTDAYHKSEKEALK